MPPSPTSCSAWFTTPLLASIQLQAMPAATSGITCGMNRMVRAAVPKRAIEVIADGRRDPEPDGDRNDGEIGDELEGVAEDLEEVGTR